jgi:hypothetical protein
MEQLVIRNKVNLYKNSSQKNIRLIKWLYDQTVTHFNFLCCLHVFLIKPFYVYGFRLALYHSKKDIKFPTVEQKTDVIFSYMFMASLKSQNISFHQTLSISLHVQKEKKRKEKKERTS